MSRVIGNELPAEVCQLLNREVTTVVMATVDADGQPWTAPFHDVAARDTKTLRAAIFPKHKTLENIRRDPRVMLCIMDEGNIAVSVRGKARIVAEQMATVRWPSVIVEIKVEEVKSDVVRFLNITTGVRFEMAEEHKDILRKTFAELKGP